MKRLDFILPDWTRIIWASAKAKTVWEPRIDRISNAFLEIEKQSVFHGIRDSCLSFLKKGEYDYENKRTISQRKGIVLYILEETYIGDSYSNSNAGNILHHESNSYRVVYTKSNLIDEWINAWMNSDNIKIGKLLNYPDCCIDFFQKYWVEEKFIDTTYPMSLNGTNGPKECNILLRWLGVRAVSHLPCSFSCERTYEQALKNIEFGRYLGFNEEMDWLEEMLSWPVQWSALHGIAEIKTPILKISTRTDATADLVVVNKEGFVYPEEGVSGNKFPYINKSKTHLTKTMSFKKSILLDKLWRDNGFYSFEAMECSHKVILDLVKNFFKEKVPVLSVSDFGCGNGYLLKKLSELKIADKYRFFGCELDFNRYKNIDIVMKGVENVEYQFECRNMYDESYYPEVMKETDLDIITSGRFFEVPEETAIKFIREFAKKPERILVIYSYSDRTHELKGPQTLELLKKAGFTFEMLDKNENMGCLAYLGKLKPITSKKLELKVL